MKNDGETAESHANVNSQHIIRDRKWQLPFTSHFNESCVSFVLGLEYYSFVSMLCIEFPSFPYHEWVAFDQRICWRKKLYPKNTITTISYVTKSIKAFLQKRMIEKSDGILLSRSVQANAWWRIG